MLVLATNHLPRIDDDTEAVWRRIRVIPFTVQIPEAERDKHLKERLRAEADAVLTWIIEGWRDYRQRGGLDEPDTVMVATNEYKADSDAVSRFIEDECYTGGAQSSATTQVLYKRWGTWGAQDGCPPLSRIAFGRALTAKGYPTDDKSHDRIRRGICLKSQVESEL
jgi:putative DNA primase/helicase